MVTVKRGTAIDLRILAVFAAIACSDADGYHKLSLHFTVTRCTVTSLQCLMTRIVTPHLPRVGDAVADCAPPQSWDHGGFPTI